MTEKITRVDQINTEYDKIATIDLGETLATSNQLSSSHYEINTLAVDPKTEGIIYKRKIQENRDHLGHANRLTTEINSSEETLTLNNYMQKVAEILNDREILDNAQEFVQTLEENEYTTVTLSSSPTAVSLPLSKKIGASFDYKWKDYLFNDEGEFDGIYLNPNSKGGKHEVIENLQEIGYEVVHFGNGNNDRKAVETADNGIIQRNWRKNPEDAYERALEEIGVLQ